MFVSAAVSCVTPSTAFSAGRSRERRSSHPRAHLRCRSLAASLAFLYLVASASVTAGAKVDYRSVCGATASRHRRSTLQPTFPRGQPTRLCCPGSGERWRSCARDRNRGPWKRARRESFSGRSSLSCVYYQPRPGSLRRLFCTQESSRPFDLASPDPCGHRATSSGASKLSSHLAWDAPRQIAILSHDPTARFRVDIALLLRSPAHSGGLWHWRTCDHLADMMRLEVLFSAVLCVVFTETLRPDFGLLLGFPPSSEEEKKLLGTVPPLDLV